jgi:outer membrane protein assembly factor BamD (BamD/ComL family)
MLVGIHWLVEGSNLETLTSEHMEPETAAKVDFYVGQLFLNVESYEAAETYFTYLMSHYPESPFAERANVSWLQCLSHMFYRGPVKLANECKAFLSKYPDSVYGPKVHKLLDTAEDRI